MTRTELVLEHSRRVNAGDVDGLVALYAEGAGFEDPVGSGRRLGRDALRAHFEQTIAANTREVTGKPVAGQDGMHALVPITAVMDYLPKGPGFAERGWLTPSGGLEPKRLKCEYVLMIRAGADGLIEESRAFWGRSDLEVEECGSHPETAVEALLLDEATRKKKTLEYARLMNAGDVEGILDMFSDDVVFEDPVGAVPIRGKDRLREHIAWSITCNAHETPGRAVTSMDGRWVVVPTTVEVRIPTKITFDIVSVVEIGDDGLTRHVRAFWGLLNTKVGDGPELTGIQHILTVIDHLKRMGGPARESASPA
jgi:steroid delta-isomerase